MNIKNDCILRLPDVLKRTGLSRSTLYELVKEGEFPKQTRIAKRAVGWKSSHITKWIEHRPQS